MEISKNLIDYVIDADLSTKLESVEYSANLREIVTVEYMINQFERR